MVTKEIGFDEFLLAIISAVSRARERVEKRETENRKQAEGLFGSKMILSDIPATALRAFHGYQLSGLSFEFDFGLDTTKFGKDGGGFLEILDGDMADRNVQPTGHMKIVIDDKPSEWAVLVNEGMFMSGGASTFETTVPSLPRRSGFISRMFRKIFKGRVQTTRFILNGSQMRELRLLLNGI
ncbi:MAG: hypothetical protein HGA72_07950 [Chlorobiaceae bacterium]|jgi:hypothetical protein|nr:hypothetical protein [Chlorobiaceae bacterium]NTW63834.1 hypothetical protein [Chlorobiaceae bacterium]